jgi:hypothetical protein
MDLDLAEVEDLEKLSEGMGVPLLFRNDESIRRLVALDPVAVDSIEVREPLPPVLREVVRPPRRRHP